MNKTCKHCDKSMSVKNFYPKSDGRYWSYCKSCESLRKKMQLVNFKKQCLEYKDQTSCSVCGYDTNVAAIDFHHRDPNAKDFNISKVNKLTLDDIIKSELDKCDVVCSNCHREIHSLEDGIFTPKCLSPKQEPTYCIDCLKPCSPNSNRCHSCYKIMNRSKSKCPSKEQLKSDFAELKYFTQVGKKYGVSDNTIRKWCKRLDIKV